MPSACTDVYTAPVRNRSDIEYEVRDGFDTKVIIAIAVMLHVSALALYIHNVHFMCLLGLCLLLMCSVLYLKVSYHSKRVSDTVLTRESNVYVRKHMYKAKMCLLLSLVAAFLLCVMVIALAIIRLRCVC